MNKGMMEEVEDEEDLEKENDMLECDEEGDEEYEDYELN